MSDGRELAPGKVRRGRSLLAAVAGLGLLASLPLLIGLLGGDDQGGGSGKPAGSTGGAEPPPGLQESLSGRLAYIADDPGHPGRQRLWVLDLETGSVIEGTTFPDVDELHAAGPINSWIVAIGSDGADSVGYLVRNPSASNGSAELARGDLVSLSTDGNALLVALSEARRSTRCQDTSYELRRVVLATFVERTAFRGRLACGTLVAATLLGSRVPVISVVYHGEAQVHLLQPGDPQVLFRGLAQVAVSASGSILLEEDRTGELLVWPGGGTPRPVVTGSRVLADRIVAWSGDGRYVLVDGVLGDEDGTWRIDAAAGLAEPFPPPGYPLTGGLIAAAFADDGTLFADAPGRIVAFRATAAFPLSLPSGVPYPTGPVAWLP